MRGNGVDGVGEKRPCQEEWGRGGKKLPSLHHG